MPNATLQPFAVAEVVLTSLEALLSASALHLGEAMPDGRRLEKTEANEAWLALLAAAGMLNHVGPLMSAEPRERLQARLDELLALFAARHRDQAFALPTHLAGSGA